MAAWGDLTIDNFQPAEKVRYPLVILRGGAEGREMAVGTSWATAIRFPVINRRYVAVVELKPGINMLLLHAGSETMKFRLDYKPMSGPYKVYTVYVSAADEGETYYTTNKQDKYPIREKLNVAMKLAQAVAADAMIRSGYGRKTFPLEFDQKGRVLVHFVKSLKSGAELSSMEPDSVLTHVLELVKGEFPDPNGKWCGLLGFASFDSTTKKASGQFAFASGGHSLLGAASMEYWPSSLKELPLTLANPKSIDPATTFEASGDRHAVWANVSTAYGSLLQSLGYTFGLGKSPDTRCIMSRGADLFSRFLTAIEAPCEGHKDPTPFRPEELPHWDPFFAARLNFSPWFQPDRDSVLAPSPDLKPTIRIEGDDVVIDASYGIRVVGTQSDTIPSWFSEYRNGDPPRRLKLSRRDLRAKMQGSKLGFEIVAVDDHGQEAQITDKPDN